MTTPQKHAKTLEPGKLYWKEQAAHHIQAYSKYPVDCLLRSFAHDVHESICRYPYNNSSIYGFLSRAAGITTKNVDLLDSFHRVLVSPLYCLDFPEPTLQGFCCVLESFHIPTDFVTGKNVHGLGNLSHLEKQDLPVILRDGLKALFSAGQSYSGIGGWSKEEIDTWKQQALSFLSQNPTFSYHKVLWNGAVFYVSGIHNIEKFTEVTQPQREDRV